MRTIDETWRLFSEKFIALWNENWGVGDAYVKNVYDSKEVQSLAQKAYMRELFEDTLGYGAAKMIR